MLPGLDEHSGLYTWFIPLFSSILFKIRNRVYFSFAKSFVFLRGMDVANASDSLSKILPLSSRS